MLRRSCQIIPELEHIGCYYAQVAGLAASADGHSHDEPGVGDLARRRAAAPCGLRGRLFCCRVWLESSFLAGASAPPLPPPPRRFDRAVVLEVGAGLRHNYYGLAERRTEVVFADSGVR